MQVLLGSMQGKGFKVKVLSPHLSRVVSQQRAPENTAPDGSVPAGTAQRPGQSPQADPGNIEHAEATSLGCLTHQPNGGVASADEDGPHTSDLDKESRPNRLQVRTPYERFPGP